MKVSNSTAPYIVLAVCICLSIPLAAQATCDEEAVAAAKQEFRRLQDFRRIAPDMVSDAEFRAVSEQYIWLAEDCYAAHHGSDPLTSHSIDEGGLWTAGIKPRHNLHGTKWGANSPFLTPGSNPDATGPRTPGGEITFSYMANGVSIGNDADSGASCAPTCTNTSIYSFVFTDSGTDTEQARCLQREIGDAFAAWSAVADITFTPASDNGANFDAPGASGDIRIGFHPIDGTSGILAHAFFPPPNGTSAAGDIHFDLDESWACTNEVGLIDFGIVALHEIGHAIGLRHETGGDTAVMNPSYNAALNFGPAADDIIGLGEIYGGSPLGGHTFFGKVGIGTDTPARALELSGDTDDTAVRVSNESSTVKTRILFELFNLGGAGVSFNNQNRGSSWSFLLDNAVTPNFVVTRLGSGVHEFTFKESGDLVIQGMLTQLSDRYSKEHISAVNGGDLLAEIEDMPIFKWSYKSDPDSALHIGPMAQDFRAAFGLGRDDRYLSIADTSGVALAAIQELYRIVKEQRREIEQLREEIGNLRQAGAP